MPLPFDVESFLRTLRSKTKILEFSKKGNIFVQGDPADAVFYVQKGRVKLTIVSEQGKAAIIGVLNDGNFFGEGCMAGQVLRMMTASAITTAHFSGLKNRLWWPRFMNATIFPNFSSPMSFRGTSATKQIWLTSFLIQLRSVWLVFFCYSPTMGKKTVPFSPRELVARLRALIRRASRGNAEGETVLLRQPDGHAIPFRPIGAALPGN